jgi:hypothetical protein
MGGSAWAVTLQSGDALIAKRTLSGNRLRLNTVTGAEVKEGSLGKVPKADLASRLPALVWHQLVLVNDWTNYNGIQRPPAWALDAQGIVHFRGAIKETAPTDDTFAHLPIAVRPVVAVWLPTDMESANTGRVNVFSDGGLVVEATVDIVDARAFTNLDGLTYSLH